MHRVTSKDADTKAWFDYCRSIFPQSVRKASPDVDFYNVSTYQCSILFNNMGSFNRKSEFRKTENIDKPISSNGKYHVTSDPHLSLLTEFWRNNYARVILTAEADSLPTDAIKLLSDYGFVGCHSNRSNDLSVHTRINSSGYFRVLWESDVDDRNGHAAIFQVKFGKTSERAVRVLPIWSPWHPLRAATSVQLRTPSSLQQVPSMTPKKRQLVTRSGLPRLRCCVDISTTSGQ